VSNEQMKLRSDGNFVTEVGHKRTYTGRS